MIFARWILCLHAAKIRAGNLDSQYQVLLMLTERYGKGYEI